MVSWSKDLTPILLNGQRSTKENKWFFMVKKKKKKASFTFSVLCGCRQQLRTANQPIFSSKDYLFLLIINKNLCNPQSATYASFFCFGFVSSHFLPLIIKIQGCFWFAPGINLQRLISKYEERQIEDY